jgi:hypothetical protein
MKTNFLILHQFAFFHIQKKDKSIVVSPDEYHAAVENVTQIMIHDIFSPPVASRIFIQILRLMK